MKPVRLAGHNRAVAYCVAIGIFELAEADICSNASGDGASAFAIGPRRPPWKTL
jgi:hypothetical protein